MTQEDLQAHLAALVRLENVGVLLGAGASMGPLGGMTLAALWNHFISEYPTSHKWLLDQGFTTTAAAPPNVEELADALDIARAEWERQKLPDVLQLDKVRCDLQRAVIRASLLQEAWWQEPAAVDHVASPLADHRTLLQKLTAARQPGQPSPWIFTTNYDLAIEWAGESIGLKVSNGFDGLHNRAFAPHNFDLGFRNTLARGEARFGTYNIYLVKLHGSLTWRASQDGTSYIEHPAAYLWPSIDDFLKGETGDGYPGPMVFPSAAKYLQTVGFVLGELLRRFTDVLARPQTCLITCGYSFSDEHVNRIVATALQNPTLQLVIYLPEAARSGDQLDVDRCSPWVRRIAALGSPQVTVVGGGAAAFFGELVDHLPDPAIYDEQAARIREMLRQYHADTGGGAGGGSSSGGGA